MVTISLSSKHMPDKHRFVYVNENDEKKHVDLSGFAGSFPRKTGYVSDDGLRAVGWRYKEEGQLCYELFNVGHTAVCAPVKPCRMQALGYLLSGKRTEKSHKAFLASFEDALNRGGWKTVAREEINK